MYLTRTLHTPSPPYHPQRYGFVPTISMPGSDSAEAMNVAGPGKCYGLSATSYITLILTSINMILTLVFFAAVVYIIVGLARQSKFRANAAGTTLVSTLMVSIFAQVWLANYIIIYVTGTSE